MQFCIRYTLIFAMLALMLGDTYVALGQADMEPLFLFRGARALGLGNAYEAIADDSYAIHYNPAGLAQVNERIFQFLIIRGRITTDLIDESRTLNSFLRETVDPIVDSEMPLTDTNPELVSARERLVERAEQILVKRHGLDFGFPSFGFVKPLTIAGYRTAVGISLYTQAIVNARIVEAGLPWADKAMEMLDNPILYRVTVQGSLATALSIEIPTDRPFLKAVNLGIGFRLIRRGTFTDSNNPFTIQDMLDPDEFKQTYFDLEANDDLWEFVRQNIDSTTGYSTDLGVLLFPNWACLA